MSGVNDNIPIRAKEFLSKTPPFNLLEEEDLNKVLKKSKIVYKDKGVNLFTIGEQPTNYFYIIERGSINLINEEGILVSRCDEGEILGIAPLLRKDHYRLTAYIEEETLLYEINWQTFNPMLLKYAQLSLYFASGMAIGYLERSNIDQEKPQKVDDADTLLKIRTDKSIISIPQGTSCSEAANIMLENNIGSIIVVDKQKRPVGIATRSDFLGFVASKRNNCDDLIDTIMSSPVKTYKLPMTLSDAILTMMSDNVRRIIFTIDGTPQTEVIGIFSEHDVLVTRGQNTIILFKQVKKTSTISELKLIRAKFENLVKTYLKIGTTVRFLTHSSTQLNDKITECLINKHIEKLPNHVQNEINGKWSWIAFGSQGRREQILHSDQDNAIILDDSIEHYRDILLDIAAAVNHDLNEIGFIYCPANVMARNPFFTRTISEWRAQIKKWIMTPEEKSVMYLVITLDSRVIYGSQNHQDFLDREFELISNNDLTLAKLAENAFNNPPPLNIFRNFMVEKSGDHKNEFDIKTRAIIPIADIARVLSILNNFHESKSTLDRLNYAAEIDINNKNLIKELKNAFLLLLEYRIRNGLKNLNSGRYMPIENLEKIEKQKLRVIFNLIEEMQDILKIKVQGPNRGLEI